jgi:hypothetical protein
MMKKVFRTLFDIADSVLAYILTVAGILFSNVVPLIKSNEPFTIDMGIWRIAASMVIAFIFVGQQEQLTADESGSNAKAREGRRKNFKNRMANALAHGFMWAQLINIAS